MNLLTTLLALWGGIAILAIAAAIFIAWLDARLDPAGCG